MKKMRLLYIGLLVVAGALAGGFGGWGGQIPASGYDGLMEIRNDTAEPVILFRGSVSPENYSDTVDGQGSIKLNLAEE